MDPRPDDSAEVSPFGSLDLDSRLLAAVGALGFSEPTPIQREAMPHLLAGRDVIGRARTGSGKTAAFGLPLLHRVADGGAVRALVLAPTRELALQVTDAIRDYAKRLPVRIACIYGGAAYDPQIRALESGVTVLVATPGRLLDHLDRGTLDLSAVEVLVLDEADEMLRMGFIDDVTRILEATPATRQVCLFSATMPDPIRKIADAHLRDPVVVQVESAELAVDHIEQRWVKVPARHKIEALVRVLQGEVDGTALVFARTRAGCAEVADMLAKAGVAAEALHGDLNQAARERIVHRLRSGRLEVLIATDVAARGIDIDHITHVINYDLPMDTEIYVHRIGRTGRMGRRGRAISFVTPDQRRRLRFLENDLGVRIDEMRVPSDADIARNRRRGLLDRLDRAATDERAESVRAWLRELIAAGRSPEELAVAALTLLADDAVLAGGAASEAPRAAFADGGRRGGSKGNRDAFAAAEGEIVEIYIATGRQWGARPGDIVGALANECGVPGARIGKVTILDRKAFVGLPKDVAAQVLADHPTVEIRGATVAVRPARPRMERDDRGERPDRGQRRERPERPERSERGPRARPDGGGARVRRGG